MRPIVALNLFTTASENENIQLHDFHETTKRTT